MTREIAFVFSQTNVYNFLVTRTWLRYVRILLSQIRLSSICGL